MADFKKYGPKKFDNVVIVGELEYKVQPWTMIFKTKFKINPKSYAKEYFNEDLSKFHIYLANDKIGLRIINKTGNAIIVPGWQFDAAYYAYDHDPKQFRFDKSNDFQIDFYCIAAQHYEQDRDLKGLIIPFSEIAKNISKLPNFQTDRYVEIVS